MDLNLLVALDALLTEGSVTGAARRLGLSVSAMSRTLARLRAATGDPLLTPSGRDLAPTPRALTLRARVPELRREVESLLRPTGGKLDPAELDQIFTLRANEGFVALFAAPLVVALSRAAPRARIRFAPKPEKDARPLREGLVDLDVGVLGDAAPEARTRKLFDDCFLGVARARHPLFAARITPKRYAEHGHVVASRRGASRGPVDEALEALGFSRNVVAVVPGFPEAVGVARRSDLIALAPRSFLFGAAGRNSGVKAFALPVATPAIAVSAIWHPRLDADPAQRWFRELVTSVCKTQLARQVDRKGESVEMAL